MNDGDDGELAFEIIKEILIRDEAIGGRLRLIAIYTGNRNSADILGQNCSETECSRKVCTTKSKTTAVLLSNSTGLRLVWREKSMGNDKLVDAVSETQLPKVLLDEFAKLSNGLLSNVALATISSMRDTTHHVLRKFQSELDAPFLHHRASLKNSYKINGLCCINCYERVEIGSG